MRLISRVKAALAARPLLALAATAVASFIAGAALLYWVDRADFVQRVMSNFAEMGADSATQDVAWTRVSSLHHQLEVAEITVAPRLITGGAIEVLDDDILIASPQGTLTYLTDEGALRSLGAAVPLNIEGLRQSRVYDDPRFLMSAFRMHDLLAVRTGEASYDLYVSHDRYVDECIEFAISRIRLTTSEDDTIQVDGAWSEVWTASPCLRFKDRGGLYEVGQGGRMVQQSADTLLVTVGDYQRDGFFDSASVSMDPAYDHGKLIELNLSTGQARHVAIGMRNAQGLLIDGEGRIWTSEHGPQGGDEINLIEDGANYGWPRVTYGMTYGSPPGAWPANSRVGGHDDYERPRYAFMPSIGISELHLPDAEQFPNWRGNMLVGSLIAETLFVVRTDGDDVVYAEPINLGHRLRDIASLPDGRLAILADHSVLLLVRNAANGEDANFVVSGLRDLPAFNEEEVFDESESLAEQGEAYFASACASCHSVTGEEGIGPPLDGILGRDIASIEDFGYSAALAAEDGAWTEDRLENFVQNPEAFAPGTTMAAPGLHPRESRRIIAYLRTLE